MKYTKPELLLIGSALSTVQGVDKPQQTFLDHRTGKMNATIGAYEADE